MMHRLERRLFWAQTRRTAFDWRAYVNRRGGLRLLRASKVHVDTLISTEDGFSDTVHWQAIIALCPELIDGSQLTQTINHLGKITWRQLVLPARINGPMARKILECAYGEQVILNDLRCLREFYQLSRDYNISCGMKICLNHAKSLLDTQNCVQLLLVSLRHKHQRLRRAAYLMIRSNFKLILNVNAHFHLIPSHYLRRLLLDDFLKLNEDEEFAWLAIVRWMKCDRMTTRDLIELYNQMVSPPPLGTDWPAPHEQHRLAKEYFRYATGGRNIGQPQLTNSAINFYTQAIPFDWTSSTSVSAPTTLEIKSSSSTCPLELDDLVPLSDTHRGEKIYDLIKCLRFMRFRSLNAFNTILASELVRGNDRLETLVNHMRLVYMVRNKMPLDKAQLGLSMPGHLERIKLGEIKGPKRVLRLAVGFVKNRNGHMGRAEGRFGRMEPAEEEQEEDKEEEIQSQSEKPSKLKQQEQASHKMLVARDVEQLTSDCLRWVDKPRVPNSVALLMGGWQDGAVSKSMMAYDFISDKWFKLNIRLPEPRAFHASCSSPKTSQIFILGGTNGETILNSVLRFDPASDIVRTSTTKATKKLAARQAATGSRMRCEQAHNDNDNRKDRRRDEHCGRLTYRFHNLCPMSEGRCHLSSVFHSDGRLYALGGHNGRQRLRSGEWYDANSNQWHPIAEMTIARSDASACSHDNKIFIAGGQISDQFIQSSVEFYKPNDDTWTFAAPMIIPRMSFRLVSYRNHLLAIGGTNGLMGGDEIGSVTRSVERYNPSLSSWSLCTALSQKRSSFGAMNIEDNLIVVGGYGGRGRLKTCESLKIGHFSTNNQHQQQQPPPRQPIHLQFGTMPASAATPAGKNLPSNANANANSFGRQHLAPSANNRLFSGLRGPPISPIRSAMKWAQRADLPAKRSGFSISVVGPLRNARDMTYHGSKRQFKGPSVVKKRSRWHKLKIIKRRKLIKHLKIALVVTVVILIM